MRYYLAALAIGATPFMPPPLGISLAVSLVLVVGIVLLLAVVAERDRPAYRPPREAERDWLQSPERSRRALIVGAGAVGQTLARNLEADGRYVVVGFVDDDPALTHTESLLGGRHETADVVKKYGIDEVFLAYAPTWQQQLSEELAQEAPSVLVTVVPSPYEALMQMSRVESIGDLALVRLTQGTDLVRDAAKRGFDATLALLGLLVLSPLIAVVAALVKLTSQGPAVFAQERIGRHGVPFVVYKFRTMVHNAESNTGPVLANGLDDVRLTPVGRWLRAFRIDEIPQLWNVLRGDMSLVGPRPERPHFVQQFERLCPSYTKRHQVRPGITGLAQVCAGYHTDPRDKLRFDLIYVSHQSFWLDLLILLRTILVVIRPVR
jgi:exopolysaccharide biosynthesis polyprenyl glycosylphosphotransferase